MKINWGTGIVIGIITFMGFIMVMVVTMMTNKEYDHDLVTENYYAKDLAYQTEINAEENTKTLSKPISIEKSEEGIWIFFPEEVQIGYSEGLIQLYRPSNERLDFQIPLKIENSKMLIPSNKLIGGRWKLTIDWQMKGEKYLFKKELVY
ncbi:MAG: FixH family protein [Flavobacteriaceae bacterium]